ncbi:DUF6803 family protein [Cohnella luojiensis]|uniref:DUF6803 family protein n=1 Tax=Cohnella luojiensis TaxID=652876 RepID=UPI00196A3C3B|nr:DUF6803 family protein [Cohnella luojiensis]
MQFAHFMQLLTANQPWNLIFFMAIPMLMIETIAITEFYLISNRNKKGIVKSINRLASIFFGFYFTGIFFYLIFNVVIPLTKAGEWLNWVDIAAVVINLSGVLFLLPLAILELGMIFKKKTVESKLKIHFILVSGFLIVGHAAMILGMVDLSIIDLKTANGSMDMNMNTSMTHYMTLLMENQPLNLIVFLAIPIILVEAITIMEFFVVFKRQTSGTLWKVNKAATIFMGLYFTVMSIYLIIKLVIPITRNDEWLTWVDWVAVGFYISTALFVLPMAIMELGLIFKKKPEEKKTKIRFALLSGAIIVFCLIGMVFGSVNPNVVSKSTGNGKMDTEMNLKTDTNTNMEMEKKK